MGLFKSARLSDATLVSSVDDEVNALEAAIVDLLGLTTGSDTAQIFDTPTSGVVTAKRDLTMDTGKKLTLAQDPTSALEAATKQYVDNAGVIVVGGYTSSPTAAVAPGGTGTYTVDGVYRDDASYYDSANKRYLVPTGYGGLHLVVFTAQLTSLVSGCVGQLNVEVNGTANAMHMGDLTGLSGGAYYWQGSLAAMLNLSDGDYVEFVVVNWPNSAGNITGSSSAKMLLVKL